MEWYKLPVVISECSFLCLDFWSSTIDKSSLNVHIWNKINLEIVTKLNSQPTHRVLDQLFSIIFLTGWLHIRSLCWITPALWQWFRLIVGHKTQWKWSLWSNQLMFWKQKTIILTNWKNMDVWVKANWMYSISPCLVIVPYTSQSVEYLEVNWLVWSELKLEADQPELLRYGHAACWSHPSSSPAREILLGGDLGWGKHARFSHWHFCSSVLFCPSVVVVVQTSAHLQQHYSQNRSTQLSCFLALSCLLGVFCHPHLNFFLKTNTQSFGYFVEQHITSC